jgi:hypothetical protein
MSRHLIGYQHSNGMVEYIEFVWNQSFDELNRYIYDNFKNKDQIVETIKSYDNTSTAMNSYKFFLQKREDIISYYLYCCDIWYILCNKFTLYFPKKLELVIPENEITNCLDSMHL